MKPSANHKVPLQPGHTLAVWNATSDKLMQDYWAAKGGKPQGPFTKEDVAKHKTATDAWIVINTRVYDISLYLEYHPGGKDILLGASGKDGTAQIRISISYCVVMTNL